MKRKAWARTKVAGTFGLDLGHVAGDALASGATGSVMRMLLENAVRRPFGESGP
jgi:hypothetical protein